MTRIKLLKPRLAELQVRTAREPAKTADRFYSSTAWLALMARLRKVRGSICQHCAAKGRVVGDHIIELQDGGAPLDEANVQLLCWSCHTIKTNQRRLERLRGPLSRPINTQTPSGA